MKLPILALLLAVVWAPAPQPEETEGSARTAQNVKQQADHKQQQGDSLTARPAVPASLDGEGSQITTQNKEKPVRIAQPIAITTKPDYATWVFSALLVAVGALQVWLLRGTL